MRIAHYLNRLRAMPADTILQRARWSSRRLQERMGPLGLGAAALLIAGLAYCFAVQMPLTRALAEDKIRLTQDIAKLKSSSRGPVDTSPAARLRDRLNGDSSAQKLGIFETLKQYGLEARESTYRKDDEVKGKLERWSMNIAMTGRYADLIRALHVFAEQPLLRIDAVTLDRQRIEDDKLNIGLRISLLGAES